MLKIIIVKKSDEKELQLQIKPFDVDKALKVEKNYLAFKNITLEISG